MEADCFCSSLFHLESLCSPALLENQNKLYALDCFRIDKVIKIFMHKVEIVEKKSLGYFSSEQYEKAYLRIYNYKMMY